MKPIIASRKEDLRARRIRLGPKPLGYLFGALLSVGVGGVILLALGANPLTAFASLVEGSYGSPSSLSETLTLMTPIVLTGLAVVVPLQAGLLNVGGEGQLVMGAVVSAWIAFEVPDVRFVAPLLSVLAGGVGGALWAFLPAIGRARLGINEIVSTIMLNFVALFLMSWAVNFPLREAAGVFPQTDRLPSTSQLPRLPGEFRVHVGTLLIPLIVVAVAFVIGRTGVGYRLRIVGQGPQVCEYLGVPRARFLMGSLMIGGFLAGIAGALQILGVQGRLVEGFNPGFGFDGIAAAFLGGGNAIAASIGALILASLRAGGANMQRATQIPVSAVILLAGIFIVVTLGSRYYLERMYATRRRLSAEPVVPSEDTNV